MKTCCFIGHRDTADTAELRGRLRAVVTSLIESGADTFLFGSRSAFNDICLKTVTELKTSYPHIRRVYVRAEYEYIDGDYENCLLRRYDATYFSERARGAGRAAYVMRNREIIDASDACVFYCDENLREASGGTRAAYEYAVKRGKRVVNMFLPH